MNLLRKFFATLILCFGILPLASTISMAAKSGTLEIVGYQAVTNVVFIDPAKPGFLQVRWAGSGALSHLGQMSAQTVDQQVNLATGELTSTVTFTDRDGDTLVIFGAGPTVIQPDGLFTFSGSLTVIGGTGKFSQATGSMTYEGWSRVTNATTSEGIGFFTVAGSVAGTSLIAAKFISQQSSGYAVFDGNNLTFTGQGRATHAGKYKLNVQSTEGPFNSTFVGIINGKIVVATSFAAVWTLSNNDTIYFEGLELVSFEPFVLPDGTVVPDITKENRANVFGTAVGGTGRFDEVDGVSFETAVLTPTSPTTISAQISGNSFLSR